MERAFALSYAAGKRLVVGIVGGTVAILGIAMIVLPGPGMLVIPLGLGILAAEFAWARRWLEKLERGSKRIVERLGIRSA